MPSYQEICELFNYKSKNAAAKLVTKLAKFGVLEKDARGRLIPSFDERSIRFLGLVEAGFPSPAEEAMLDTITLDDWLVRDQDSTYMLQVKGDSMMDAGILGGDYILVERTDDAKVGEIVVAELDGDWTLKYLRKDRKGQYYLQPANKAYSDMYPEGDLRVAARLIASVRKYED